MENIPSTGFMRLPDVLKVIPICKSYWWQGVKEGAFPKPVKLGRVSMWKTEDIHELIQQISEEGLNG